MNEKALSRRLSGSHMKMQDNIFISKNINQGLKTNYVSQL